LISTIIILMLLFSSIIYNFDILLLDQSCSKSSQV